MHAILDMVVPDFGSDIFRVYIATFDANALSAGNGLRTSSRAAA